MTTPTPFAQIAVDPSWLNASGHMNAGQYIIVFETVFHAFMATTGVATGAAPFLREMHTCYLAEARKGDVLDIHVHVLGVAQERLHLLLLMARHGDDVSIASTELDILNIDLASRKPTAWTNERHARLAAIMHEQSGLARPKQTGRAIRGVTR
jgi:acyl-CoA thioesterase FadM